MSEALFLKLILFVFSVFYLRKNSIFYLLYDGIKGFECRKKGIPEMYYYKKWFFERNSSMFLFCDKRNLEYLYIIDKKNCLCISFLIFMSEIIEKKCGFY